eukprot:NODE_42_length_34079_cov_0.552619.p23 type:complete len:117 gc:universal NODE_42_length_34079_cov_0.552619:10604-10254(-)
MIPFSTFFTATFMGKAFVKASIQSIFMIALFSEEALNVVLTYIKSVNYSAFLWISHQIDQQKLKYDKPVGSNYLESESVISNLWNYLVLAMILYFVIGFLETIANWQLEDESSKNK